MELNTIEQPYFIQPRLYNIKVEVKVVYNRIPAYSYGRCTYLEHRQRWPKPECGAPPPPTAHTKARPSISNLKSSHHAASSIYTSATPTKRQTRPTTLRPADIQPPTKHLRDQSDQLHRANPHRRLSKLPAHLRTCVRREKLLSQCRTSRRAKNGSTSRPSSSKRALPPFVTPLLFPPLSSNANNARSQNQTRITTRYSIKPVKPRKAKTDADGHTDAAAAEQQSKAPRAALVIKTYDPVSGVTLKYRTTKAAEVTRLVGTALGRLGRGMAALPDLPEEAMDVDAAAPAGGPDSDAPAAPAAQQGKGQASGGGGGGGGGKKKKKGKK